jgi:small subunit ribosomal protein S5
LNELKPDSSEESALSEEAIREQDFEEVVVKVNRTAKVVKGGRRFSFSALVVVGNRNGRVGWGFGKANDVPSSVEKAVKDAHKNMVSIARRGSSIPHQIIGRHGAARVALLPAAEGTGVIAGAAVRAPVELAGIRDILTKSIGSTNPINLVKAAIDGLNQLKTLETIEQLRGVKVQ